MKQSKFRTKFISTRVATLEPLCPEPSNVNGPPDPTNPQAKSPANGKQKENEPIADVDLPPAAPHLHVQRTRPDLVFPSLPPITESNSDLFEEKMKICEQLCDFESSEFDIDAKEIKATTLKEISTLCDTPDIIQKLNSNRLIQVLLLHVFRPKLLIEAKYLFFADLVPINELAMPHISICYEILLKIMVIAPTNPAFGKDFFKQILSRFDQPDITERTQLAAVANLYVDAHLDDAPKLSRLVSAQNIDYMDGKKSPHVLIPSLMVLHHLHQKSPTSFVPLYMTEFIPLLGALHFVACTRNFKELLEAVLNIPGNAQEFVMPTLHALMTHWPTMTALKEAAFLTMTTFVLTKLTPRQFKEVMRDIFKLYAQASISPHQKVVEAAFSIWNQIQIEPLIMDNSRILFPLIYPPVSKALREHSWSGGSSNELLQSIMSSMNRIDSFVFQELCRGKVSVPQNDEREDIRTWATIARTAQRHDTKINLATKLSEIQRTFTKPQNISLQGGGKSGFASSTNQLNSRSSLNNR